MIEPSQRADCLPVCMCVYLCVSVCVCVFVTVCVVVSVSVFVCVCVFWGLFVCCVGYVILRENLNESKWGDTFWTSEKFVFFIIIKFFKSSRAPTGGSIHEFTNNGNNGFLTWFLQFTDHKSGINRNSEISIFANSWEICSNHELNRIHKLKKVIYTFFEFLDEQMAWGHCLYLVGKK